MAPVKNDLVNIPIKIHVNKHVTIKVPKLSNINAGLSPNILQASWIIPTALCMAFRFFQLV